MRRLAVLLAFLMLAPVAARAQNFDIFAGYSYEQLDQPGPDAKTSGWEASLTYKINPYLGVTGAFTGNYGTVLGYTMNLHDFYVGPQLSLPMRYSPFVHVLFGDMRLSLPGLLTNAFSMQLGGGLDIRVNHYLSIRAIEADAVTGNIYPTSSAGHICSGIVLHF
jgi:hypothetical protein